MAAVPHGLPARGRGHATDVGARMGAQPHPPPPRELPHALPPHSVAVGLAALFGRARGRRRGQLGARVAVRARWTPGRAALQRAPGSRRHEQSPRPRRALRPAMAPRAREAAHLVRPRALAGVAVDAKKGGRAPRPKLPAPDLDAGGVGGAHAGGGARGAGALRAPEQRCRRRSRRPRRCGRGPTSTLWGFARAAAATGPHRASAALRTAAGGGGGGRGRGAGSGDRRVRRRVAPAESRRESGVAHGSELAGELVRILTHAIFSFYLKTFGCIGG
mmetsp:Transcript_16329/g.53368  ORF Transcript_16329/g.53368 Transcript_16329/m.53368 type:complete len:275 (+) Transcript_16329:912-1736(+)